MLTKLRIQNFKAWKDTGEIRLAPITVFFGANSAGKTSILQFLLMLKQTAESSDRSRVLHPGDGHSLVELGTFQDLIFEHDLRQKLEFELTWSLPDLLIFDDPLKQKSYEGDAVTFRANIASSKTAQYVQWLEYQLLRSEQPIVSVLLQKEPRSEEYSLGADGYHLVRMQGRVWPLPPPTRFYGFPDEVSARFQNAAFTNDLVLSLERQLKRVLHLGPLREIPNRTYAWAGDAPEHVGPKGAAAVAALLAGSNRKIALGNLRGRHFQEVVARWLKQLGLLESFEARKIASQRKEYEVRVRTENAMKDVDLTDVGFGISQVLPVVVECFYVKPHSTVIIEQPELHLHPRVQSELADLFIEAIHSRENRQDRSIQFIIESHSEHFLQRLQRRLAEGALEAHEVVFYFCQTGSQGSELHMLELNQYGEIANWPKDFFGDPVTDLTARLEAAAAKESDAGAQ